VLALLAAFAAPIAASAQGGPPQDRYIVVLNAGAGFPDEVAADVALRANGRVGYVYEHALQGFSITMPRAARAGIARDPRVAYVEEDRPVSINIDDQVVPTGIDRIYITPSEPDIDGNDLRVDVDVAVLDTGIDRQHPDLNVVGGTNCLKTTDNGPPWARGFYCDDNENGDDDHYHGTHVAGTIAALDNDIGVVGVAPGARLWAVKVLDSGASGWFSGIVAGIDWVAERGGIEVINMSLSGSGTSTAMNDAIRNAVEKGVVVVVAASNNDADAANYTPANAPYAITVSALADFNGLPGGLAPYTCRSDQDDTLADFSNWGEIIDIAAPGVCIYSTYPLEKGEYGTISGTSMASPHVAGAAALLASGANPPANAVEVQSLRDTLIDAGNFNWTDDSGDNFHERLLDISTFSAALVETDGGGGDVDLLPTASFIYTCDTAGACSFDGTGSSGGNTPIASYSWDFGDSTPLGSGSSPNHTYTTAGPFTAMLTVIDGDDDSDSMSDTVTILVSGGANDIYVSAINVSDKDYGKGGSFHDLTTTVVIMRDADADGVANDDVAVSGANVTIEVTRMSDGSIFSATVQTDGAGSASYVIKRVQVGDYVSNVTLVTHATYTWNNISGVVSQPHDVQ
jgi:subtilisin family serine protease